MGTPVALNGVSYTIPALAEDNWGTNVSNYLIALGTGVLQKAGGSFTLTADVDFGASFGIKSAYFKSRGNVASVGIFRLANDEGIAWRNFLEDSDLILKADTNDNLVYNGNIIPTIGFGAANTVMRMNSAGNAMEFAKLVDANIDASAAIAFSKIATTGAIVNADVNASAAIAYSKLSLSGSIVNADVNASAAIAYSKLSLSGSIVNADVNASAAIAYSKLNLATSIVNADVSASAAIAYSKLNLATSIVNADISASAAIAYSKLNLTGEILSADIAAAEKTGSGDVVLQVSPTITTPTLTSPVINTGVSGTAIDTDGALTANSDTILASQKAVKTYVTTSVAAASSIVTVDNAAGTSGVTLGTSDESFQIFAPTSAGITVKLDNSYSQGRRIEIYNNGTKDISLTANDNSAIRTIYPKTIGIVMCNTGSPADSSKWTGVNRVTSGWIDGSSTFTISAGFGTPSNIKIMYKREGKDLLCNFYWQNGTVAGSVAALDLPSGLTNDFTSVFGAGLQTTSIGVAVSITTGSNVDTYADNRACVMMIDDADTDRIWFSRYVNNNRLETINGNSFFSSSNYVSGQFRTAVSEWEEYSK